MKSPSHLIHDPAPVVVRVIPIYPIQGIRDINDALFRERENGKWDIYSPAREEWMNAAGHWMIPASLGYEHVPAYDTYEEALQAYIRHLDHARQHAPTWDMRLFGLEDLNG